MYKFLTILFLAAPLKLTAQDYGDSLSHHQIGITGSTISGYGATYSYIFNKDFRIKSTFFAYYEDQGYSNSYNWTGLFGLELQYTLQSSSVTRFYGLLGGNYYHYESHYTDSYSSEGGNAYNVYNSVNSENTITIGFGVGFEVLLWTHLSINLDVGFEYDATKNLATTDQTSAVYYYPSDNYTRRYFSVAGGAGIGYRF